MTNALIAQLGGLAREMESGSYTAKATEHNHELDGEFWHGEEGAEVDEGSSRRLMSKALDFLMLSDSMLFSGVTTGIETPPLPYSGACVCVCGGGGAIRV